jgi:hypothetical protein
VCPAGSRRVRGWRNNHDSVAPEGQESQTIGFPRDGDPGQLEVVPAKRNVLLQWDMSGHMQGPAQPSERSEQLRAHLAEAGC